MKISYYKIKRVSSRIKSILLHISIGPMIFSGNSYSIAVGAAVHGIVIGILSHLSRLPASEFLMFYIYIMYIGFLLVAGMLIVIFYFQPYTPHSGKEFALSKQAAREKAAKREKRKALQALRAKQPKLFIKLNKLGIFTPHSGAESIIPPFVTSVDLPEGGGETAPVKKITIIDVAIQLFTMWYSFTWAIDRFGDEEMKRKFAGNPLKRVGSWIYESIDFSEFVARMWWKTDVSSRRSALRSGRLLLNNPLPFDHLVPSSHDAWTGLQSTTSNLPATFSGLVPRFTLTGVTHQDVGMVVERTMLLFTTIFEATTYTQFIGAVGLYIHSFYKGSMVLAITDYISNIGFTPVEPQSGFEDIVSTLSLARESWSKFVGTALFTKVSLLITTLISVGMCSASAIEWKVAGMPVFSQLAKQKHVSAVSLSAVIVETIELFMETALQCYSQCSLKPLLYDSSAAHSFETKYLWLTAQYSDMKIGNWEAIGITSEEYYTKLCEFTELCNSLQYACRDKIEKSHILRKQEKCVEWRNEYLRVVNSGALRESPFTMCFYGGSSVGKTTIANLCNIVALNANGHASDPAKIVTWNENDKFFSNYTVDKTSIVMDDMCNTVLEHIQESPLANIIKFCNNNPEYAVMASLEDKGKIAIRPKTVIITTNVQDLQAMVLSNEPASILRRLNLRFDVRVKSAFRIAGKPFMDSTKVLKYKECLTPKEALYPDIWDIRIMDLQVAPDGNCRTVYVDLDGNIIDAHDEQAGVYSIFDILPLVIEKSKMHYALQKEIVKCANSLSSSVVICPGCSNIDILCKCHRLPTHREPIIVETVDEFDEQIGAENVRELHAYLRQRLEHYYTYEYCDYVFWVPGYIYYTPTFRLCAFLTHWRLWKDNAMSGLVTLPAAFAVLLFIFTDMRLALHLGFLWWAYQLYRTAAVLRDEYYTFYDRYDALRGASYLNFSVMKKAAGAAFCSYFTVFHVIKPIMAMYHLMDAHSALNPETEAEIQMRSKSANCWAEKAITRLPTTTVSNTTSNDRALDKISKNLVYVRYKLTNGNFGTDGIFISTNCLLIPNHAWKQPDIEIEIVRKNIGIPSHTFTSRISQSTAYHIPDTDFSLVYVANGGDWSDISCYLPLAQLRRIPVVFRYRTREGTFMDSKALSTPVRTTNGVCAFEGSTYTLEWPTFEGLCMGVLVTDSVASCIAGFHLGGKTGTKSGCAGLLTMRQYENARKMLLRVPGIILHASTGFLPEKKYGKQFFEGEDTHPKCPTNFLPADQDIAVYGGVIGRAKYYSKVVNTPISELVTAHCGVPRLHGPPRFNQDPWKPWYTALSGFSDPSVGPFPRELQWATLDYVLPLLKLVDDHHMWRKLRPLTKLETLCGVDGVRFIDQMGKTKSIGFPLGGKMSSHLTPLDSTPEQTSAWELDQRFWDEVEKLEQNALSGVRSYPIFSASLKDEPTKLTKDKIRVFTGAAIEQKLIIRKYFLPLTRILCHHSIISECAVGINAVGPEWDELHKHITQFGSDRIVAGDFSAYDQRMATSVTSATFWILLEIAKRCDYSTDDIRIMTMIVHDIISPMVAYNGTLVQFMGGNPSGQNMTVFTNSIANSLLYRVAYARASPTPVPSPFRENVAAMFYGDDSIGGVRRAYKHFNNCIMFDAMEDIGMKFTPPDKSSEHTPFMLDGTVDFLKRTSNYMPELGVTVGALDEDSIFKSLHTVMESSFLSLEEQSAVNIDGALREFTYHGREVYELRQKQLCDVARGAGITHMCSLLDETYDARMQGWRDNYISPSGDTLITL